MVRENQEFIYGQVKRRKKGEEESSTKICQGKTSGEARQKRMIYAGPEGGRDANGVLFWENPE